MFDDIYLAVIMTNLEVILFGYYAVNIQYFCKVNPKYFFKYPFMSSRF